MTDEEIEALEDPSRWDDLFDPSTVAALRLADLMSGDDTANLDPAIVHELRSHFSEVELAELILLCGQANLNNRVGNASKQLLGDS